MTNTNKFILIGNLTADAVMKKMENGKSISTFSLAVNHDVYVSDGTGTEFTWQNDVMFFNNLAIFDSYAESLNQYLLKGTKVLIEAHLIPYTWEKNGDKIPSIRIAVERVELLSSTQNHLQNQQQKENQDAANNSVPQNTDSTIKEQQLQPAFVPATNPNIPMHTQNMPDANTNTYNNNNDYLGYGENPTGLF